MDDMLRVGINGFGRIGRQVVKAARLRKAAINFVAVNDLTDAATLAHLLRYDSVHGVWHDVPSKPVDGCLDVLGDRIQVLAEKDPAKLPWKSMGVDVVLESTGHFTDRAGAAHHLTAGARGVLVSAPAKGVDQTFVFGVNDHLYDRAKHAVVSIGSCTTNGLAPVAKVLNDTFGIDRGYMTTIHAYTNDQKILDMPHKDLRRARAAALSMIPTSTGAAKAIGEVMPELKGRLDGIAVRVPAPEADRQGGRERGDEGRGGWSDEGHPRVLRGPDRLDRCGRQPAQQRVRFAVDHGDGRHPGQGLHVVRQRVGVLEPRRRCAAPHGMRHR
jgi:glyceraldehyde 3-phosphate dehydrogenase